MATRGTISIQNPDGTITLIYSHCDNHIETLLNIMDMGNMDNHSYLSEYNWLKRVVYAIPDKSPIVSIKNNYLNRLNKISGEGNDYFYLRNEIRNDAATMVNTLAADELIKLKKRKEHLTKELNAITNRLVRFNKWTNLKMS